MKYKPERIYENTIHNLIARHGSERAGDKPMKEYTLGKTLETVILAVILILVAVIAFQGFEAKVSSLLNDAVNVRAK